jgi:hypothetical protein
MNRFSSARKYFKITLRTMLLIAALSLVSCEEDTEPYPNLITKFADIHTGPDGMFTSMTTDNGANFSITNTNTKPHHPNASYRALIGFVAESTGNHPKATIYTLESVQVLADSTATLRQDPTGIESMWHEGRYINMQLTAKTHGGKHTWGYAIDFIEEASNNGREHAHYHLSLHHNQGNDPQAYSAPHYCSIITSRLPQYQNTDTITVSVQTFQGTKSWKFPN